MLVLRSALQSLPLALPSLQFPKQKLAVFIGITMAVVQSSSIVVITMVPAVITLTVLVITVAKVLLLVPTVPVPVVTMVALDASITDA